MRADERSVATPYRLLSARVPVVSLAILALVAVLAFADASAEAMVTTVGPAKVGLQPRSMLLFKSSLEEPVPEPEEFENPSGNPVVSANKTYAIYWDPTDHYHGDWQHLIDTFFQSMGAASGSFASVFAVDAQYTDAANQHALYKSAFQGAYTDTDGYPSSGCTDPQPLEAPDLIGPVVKGQHTPVCLTDKQLQEELELFIAQHSLPKGMGTIYYLLTPPGVTACLDGGALASRCSDYKKNSYSLGESEAEKEAKEKEEKTRYEESFCSYHSAVNPTNGVTGDANTILYGVIPWTAGGLGDGHLTVNDEKTPAFACQDGGYDPSSKPAGEQEKKKSKTAKEIEEFEKKSLEEQTKQKEAEELEGPRQQEPNQVKCPSPDGFCDSGLADLIVNQISVEQQNIVTNPLLNAWQDPNKHEATDECRNWFAIVLGGDVGAQKGSFAGTLYNQSLAGSNYYLNDAFNLAALKLPYPAIACLPGIRLEPQFTAPNPVNANEIVGFDGMESDITLNAGIGFSASGAPQPAYATYTWNFGDGSPPVVGNAPGAPSANSPAVSPCVAPWEAPCAASAYHSYQYGGVYEVTLTVSDVGGNTESVSHSVTVTGPPAPSSNPSEAAGTSAPGGSPAAGTPAPPAVVLPAVPALPPTPAPVLTGFAVSKSLKKVVSSGLAVRYTTNEQVAGSIQVLLDGALAKRLGVHGPAATGLPKGAPSSIVVGTAVLVTTKAGQGTIRVKFSSRTAAHLAHTHKLKLTLRLFARNASRQSPQSTTVISTVTLNR
jgi:hypothetical protein